MTIMSATKSWIDPQRAIDVPLCVACRTEMVHSCTESESPTFEHRVYECRECRSTQSFFIFRGAGDP